MSVSVPDKGTKTVFSENIRSFMKKNNKTRKELCKDLDIKYTTFCDWINARTLPAPSKIKQLEDYFKVRTGELFVISDDDSAKDQQISRLAACDKKARILDMHTLDNLDDEQVKELLDSDFVFSHRRLEDYIDESGKALKISGELDWGEPAGSEIW
ncbi:MAG: helix-turn-helix domain-containing protein [Lachnospiraceae bacterium]|nr:helix-turn-helix domain-containing protein [Lachnospiraceae bacterium]